MGYYDLASGKEIDKKVPPGKFRVVGGDTFDRESRGIWYGDYPTEKEAKEKAKEVAKGKDFFVVYVFDEQGRLIAQAGKY